MFFEDHSVMFALICAGVGVGYGIYLTWWLLKQPAGSERMQEIARAIQEGADAYLKRQYITIALVAIVPFLLLGFYNQLGWEAELARMRRSNSKSDRKHVTVYSKNRPWPHGPPPKPDGGGRPTSWYLGNPHDIVQAPAIQIYVAEDSEEDEEWSSGQLWEEALLRGTRSSIPERRPNPLPSQGATRIRKRKAKEQEKRRQGPRPASQKRKAKEPSK